MSRTLIVVLVAAGLAQAQTFTTLYNFTGGSDGGYPYAGLIQDSSGNLYGTTTAGGDLNCETSSGPSGCGVVYKLDTGGTETVLHAFSGYASDGADPYAPVVRDKADNLYGTTAEGGTNGDCLGDTVGCGTIFKIDTAGNETVLYNFPRYPDGCLPFQGMILDKSGNLYATASYCGTEESHGTIFELQGAKTFKLLYDFSGLDGDSPQYGNLIMDKSRNFYGVTTFGGVDGTGVVYKFSPRGVETVLYDFSGAPTDGCYPDGTLVQDESGNFYGTTSECGPHNFGTIWKLNKKGNETQPHKFAGGAKDGCNPLAGMVRDAKGNLYGVTYGCGAHNAGSCTS